MIDGYIYDKVNILTTGTEFYSKVFQPTLEEELKYYISNRFNFTPIVGYADGKHNLGYGIMRNNDEDEDVAFFGFWFLDNNYNHCPMDKEDASFIAFTIIHYFEGFKELSEEKFSSIEFDLKSYHFYYRFYDNPCDFHIDYFKKFFIKELGLKKDYNKYLEGLHGEEVF